MNNRKIILYHLQELQADLEDFNIEQLIKYRDVMLNRINACLKAIGETEEESIAFIEGE